MKDIAPFAASKELKKNNVEVTVMIDRTIECTCGRKFTGQKDGKLSCCAKCGQKYLRAPSEEIGWYRTYLTSKDIAEKEFFFQKKEKKRNSSNQGYRPFKDIRIKGGAK